MIMMRMMMMIIIIMIFCDDSDDNDDDDNFVGESQPAHSPPVLHLSTGECATIILNSIIPKIHDYPLPMIMIRWMFTIFCECSIIFCGYSQFFVHVHNFLWMFTIFCWCLPSPAACYIWYQVDVHKPRRSLSPQAGWPTRFLISQSFWWSGWFSRSWIFWGSWWWLWLSGLYLPLQSWLLHQTGPQPLAT